MAWTTRPCRRVHPWCASVKPLLLAQAVSDSNSDTGVIVAVITAVSFVLAALVTVLGQRSNARLRAIEKSQEALSAALDRLERRMEDGFARLADRVDRLYASRAPSPPPTFFDLPVPRRPSSASPTFFDPASAKALDVADLTETIESER